MEKIKHSFIVFAVFNNGEANLHTDFTLFDNRFIQIKDNEPVPIEDFGNWMLFKEQVTETEAYEKFLSVL